MLDDAEFQERVDRLPFAPGSTVVSRYLEAAGLTPYLGRESELDLLMAAAGKARVAGFGPFFSGVFLIGLALTVWVVVNAVNLLQAAGFLSRVPTGSRRSSRAA